MRLMRRVKKWFRYFRCETGGERGLGRGEKQTYTQAFKSLPYEVYLLWSVFMADLVIAIVRLKMMLELD